MRLYDGDADTYVFDVSSFHAHEKMFAGRCLRIIKNERQRRRFSSPRGLGLSLVDLSMSHVSTDHCRSQVDLVRCLENSNVLDARSRTSIAMEKVDRAMFVPDDVGYAEPYMNKPQSIGYESTMAEPEFHSYCCEKLESSLIPGAAVLDLGTGTGYTAAVFALMVSDKNKSGSIVAVDRVDALIESARECHRSWRQGPQIGEYVCEVQFQVAFESHRWIESCESQFFDVIHVGFGISEKDLRLNLLPKLKPNGRMIAPVIIEDDSAGTGEQWLTMFHDKQETKLRKLMCQQMIDAPFKPTLFTRQGRKDRLETLQNELNSWRENFQSVHGRTPSKQDMLSDKTSKTLFEEFKSLRSREWS